MLKQLFFPNITLGCTFPLNVVNKYLIFFPSETGVFLSVKDLALPLNVVKDSQRAKITITGTLRYLTLLLN